MSDSHTCPADWQETTLGALADYINGFPFKPRDWKTIGLPIVRITQMTDPSADIDYYDDLLPSQYRIDNGDLLFSWSATLMALIWQRGPAYLNQHIYKVTPRSDNVLSFLHHLLNHLVEPMAEQSHGTTMKHITRGDLLPYKVTVPLASEQFRIAAVLNAIDAAIAKAEAVIAKLKHMRAGLLHDLLTCGLDDNGELRDPVAHPEHFKKSKLGKVPKAWDVATLSKFVPIAEYGISSSLGSKGIPILRMNNFEHGEAKLDDIKYSSVFIPQDLMLKSGDVLFNRTNSWEHVGRTGIWRGQIDQTSFASYLVRLTPRQELLNPELLNYWLNWPSTQILMRRYATPAVQQVNINPTNLRMMDAAFPEELQEQLDMISIMQGKDSTIRSEQIELSKLRHFKAGLMADLLSGKVRVPEGLI